MTTDMQARDEQDMKDNREFEEWFQSQGYESDNFGKYHLHIAYDKALAAERARSAVLVEALTSDKGIKIDGHVYGTRPCETCSSITKILGQDFGCDLRRKKLGIK